MNKHFWLLIGNSVASKKVFGIEVLNYPLAYHLPFSSLIINESECFVQKHSRTILVSCEIAFEISKSTRNVEKKDLERCIGGYRVCIGLADTAFVDRLHNKTEREIGCCDFYSRWGDGATCIGPLVTTVSWESLKESNMNLIIDGKSVLTTSAQNYLHSPVDFLAFLVDYVTFNSGDIVSLGRVNEVVECSMENKLHLIRASVDKLGEFEMKVSDMRDKEYQL